VDLTHPRIYEAVLVHLRHDVLEVNIKLQQNQVFHRPHQATYAPFYFNGRRYG
jgi:hypothetical protein